MLAKSKDKAATEAEADAAIARAQKLMTQYKLTEDDLTLSADKLAFEKRSVPYNGKQMHPVDKLLAAAIGRYVGCQCWFSTEDATVTYFGIDSDVELALFLREIFKDAMEETAYMFFEFVYDGPRTERVVRASHNLGFAHNRIEQFNAMVEASGDNTGDGMALVVIKKDLVAKKMAEMGLSTYKSRSGKSVKVDNSAYADGYHSAKGVDVGAGRSVGSQARIAG